MAKQLIKIGSDRDDEDDGNIEQKLLELLGSEGFMLLVEHYGGSRLFVPKGKAISELVDNIWVENALKLSNTYGGNYIRVDLSPEFSSKFW